MSLARLTYLGSVTKGVLDSVQVLLKVLISYSVLCVLLNHSNDYLLCITPFLSQPSLTQVVATQRRPCI
jgi:hypothetical protein